MLGLLFMILNKLLYCDSNFIDLLLVSFLNNLCLSFLSYIMNLPVVFLSQCCVLMKWLYVLWSELWGGGWWTIVGFNVSHHFTSVELQEVRDFCQFLFALVSSVTATCLACGVYATNIYWMTLLLSLSSVK